MVRNVSVIQQDMVKGFGGIANGKFTINSKDSLPYDAAPNTLGTESDIAITDELEVGLEIE